ncbi:MAG TPA: hypothetical protein VFA94_04490 [Acidimicrobiales bacterium]|nr:hypothetical protein [Acidimicrobiales bacterium]
MLGGCRQYGNTHRDFVAHAQRAGGIVLLCMAIWAFTGFGSFWPVWVLLFLGLRLANHARHVYSRSWQEPELDEEPVPR